MEWLNYHHLRYFWMVAKEGSLRQAAAKLHISEPAISAQLQALGEALGEPLFRRQGRQLVLTETGHLVLGYAEEIFSLGQELMNSVKGMPTTRRLRLSVGVVDSVPKLVTYRLLRPVLEHQPPAHVVCREGKPDDLLPQLAAHRLDVVLSDQMAPAGTPFQTFSHLVGSSTVSFCAAAKLAAKLAANFPASTKDAPWLLPTANTNLRRSLEKWFHRNRIRPRIVGEFEDSALMKVAAADGLGIIPIATVAVEKARERYGFRAIGEAGSIVEEFYAITTGRRVTHPAIALITEKTAAREVRAAEKRAG